MSDLISKIRSAQILVGESVACDFLADLELRMCNARSQRTALDIADDLEKFGQGWLDAVAMLRHQHAEIERLTSELEACADSCESEADKSAGWAKVRMIEMANRMRRGVGERGKP